MRNKLKTLLAIYFSIIIVLTAGIGLLGINFGSETYKNVYALARDRRIKADGLHELQIQLGKMHWVEMQFFSSSSRYEPREVREYLKGIKKARDELEKLPSGLFPRFKSDYAAARITRFNAAWNQYTEIQDKISGFLIKGDYAAAAEVWRGKSGMAMEKALAAVRELEKYNDEKNSEMQRQVVSSYRAKRTRNIVALMATLLLSSGISWQISNLVSARQKNELLERFNLILENGRDIVLFFRPDGKIVEANRAARDAYGYGREELLEKNFIDLCDPKSVSFISGALDEGSLEGTSFETTGCRKDGKRFVTEVNVHRAVIDNEMLLMSIIRDITGRKDADNALKESEERYRQIVELSPDMIFVQQDGKFVYINPAGVKLLGAKNAAEIIGKPIWKYFHPDYRETVKERIRELLEKGRGVPPLEQKYVRVDGRVVDVEVMAAPITFMGLPAAQVTVRDITGRNKSPEQGGKASDLN